MAIKNERYLPLQPEIGKEYRVVDSSFDLHVPRKRIVTYKGKIGQFDVFTDNTSTYMVPTILLIVLCEIVQ